MRLSRTPLFCNSFQLAVKSLTRLFVDGKDAEDGAQRLHLHRLLGQQELAELLQVGHLVAEE